MKTTQHPFRQMLARLAAKWRAWRSARRAAAHWQQRAERAEARLKEMRFGLVADESAPEWTPEDRGRWRQFLFTTDTGRRLLEGANFYEQSMNRGAIMRRENFENNAGYARGWHAATEYFFKQLSADDRPEQVETSGERAGAPDPAERIAP